MTSPGGTYDRSAQNWRPKPSSAPPVLASRGSGRALELPPANKKARLLVEPGFSSVHVSASARGELLLDLGDGAGRASLLASAAGDAGILVGHGSNVVELKNALGASVDANATSDALISINDRLGHGSSPLCAIHVGPGATGECASSFLGLNIPRGDSIASLEASFFIPFAESALVY